MYYYYLLYIEVLYYHIMLYIINIQSIVSNGIELRRAIFIVLYVRHGQVLSFAVPSNLRWIIRCSE